MRRVLWLWVKMATAFSRNRSGDLYWLLMELAKRLRYRLPIKTRLGNGMSIWVPLSDHIGQSIYEHGYYEPDFIRLLQKLIKPGMVFFDIGAHVGQYTLVASRLVGDAGEVHSFEPDPETFQFLERNVRMNNLRNAHLNRLALSDKEGTRYLYLAPVSNLGDNSLAPPKRYAGHRCEVRCTTVDHYLQAGNVRGVDFVKIDVEGAELLFLKGAERLLALGGRPLIVMEFEEPRQTAFGNSCTQLADALKSKGYVLFALDGEQLRAYYPSQNDPMSLNVLAVPEEKGESVHTLLGSQAEMVP